MDNNPLPYRFGTSLFPLRNNADVYCGLSGLFHYDITYLQNYPQSPALYRAGIKYVREVDLSSRLERKWRVIPIILEAGESDCKGLASWRAAEIVVRHGYEARPIIIEFPDLLHIVVEVFIRGVRYLSDPSAVLGMATPAGYPRDLFYERE